MSDFTNAPTSRRNLLRVGGLGAFGAVVLAACSSDSPVGVSGSPGPATSVPPTVPPKAPTTVQLAADQEQLHTLSSVEALVAKVYADHGDKVTNPELKPLVAQFGADHTAAAEALTARTEDRQADKPNKVLTETMVAPMEMTLATEAGVLSMLRNLESTLTATYINAVGILTQADDRQAMMTHGGACARRVSLLGNDGEGELPAAALYPPTDLITGKAMLSAEQEGEG